MLGGKRVVEDGETWAQLWLVFKKKGQVKIPAVRKKLEPYSCKRAKRVRFLFTMTARSTSIELQMST